MLKDTEFVTALARGMKILTCFEAGDAELGNSQIARRAGLPPATVARLTYTLTQLGYLRSIPLRRKYALAPQVLSIAYPLLAALPERELARPHLHALAQSSGGSVCLAVVDRLQAVYVEVSRGKDAEKLPDIGTHRHLLDSSIGRALFVGVGPLEREALLNQLRLNEPARADHLRASAQAAVDDFERYGMCRTVGLAMPDWSAVAMPLLGLHGRRMAISLGVLTASVPSKDFMRRVGGPMAATAARITEAFRAAGRAACNPVAPG